MRVSNIELDDIKLMHKIYTLLGNKSILEIGIFDGRTSKHFMYWSNDVTLVDDFSYHKKLKVNNPAKKLKKLGFDVISPNDIPNKKYGLVLWDIAENYEDGYNFDQYFKYVDYEEGILVLDDIFNMTFDVMLGVIDKIREESIYAVFATNKKLFVTKNDKLASRIVNDYMLNKDNWPIGYYRSNDFVGMSYMGKWTNSFPERADILNKVI